MRPWLLLILFATHGCTSGQPESDLSDASSEATYPIVADHLDITIGAGREIVATPGSATAGSRWIVHSVTYMNKASRPIWIVGYSETYPFSGIEIRTDPAAGWRDYRVGYCGTGARDVEVRPGASYSFTAALPERYTGQDFRVTLPYRTDPQADRWVQAASEARRLVHPAPG